MIRQALSTKQQAHIMGNKLKLEFLMDKYQINKIRRENFDILKKDLLQKSINIQEALGL